MKIAICLAVFLITILIANQIIDLLTSTERKTKKRLKQTLSYAGREENNKNRVLRSQKSVNLSKAGPWLQRLANGKLFEKEKALLEQSGIPLKPEEYLGICILAGVFVFLFGFLIFKNIIPAAMLAAVGFIFPGLWVRSVKRKRVVQMEGQLLNAVVLMANSLRAGHSFMQALDVVKNETPAPLGEEFNQILRETRVGGRTEDALKNFSARIDSREIELLVTGILVQREVGGNLAEILDIIADTIDKRIKMKSKIRALTAQGRLSGWIVSLLPVALIFFIYVPHPEYARVMLSETLGQIMLAAGFILIIIGSLIIKKVVNIDV